MADSDTERFIHTELYASLVGCGMSQDSETFLNRYGNKIDMIKVVGKLIDET